MVNPATIEQMSGLSQSVSAPICSELSSAKKSSQPASGIDARCSSSTSARSARPSDAQTTSGRDARLPAGHAGRPSSQPKKRGSTCPSAKPASAESSTFFEKSSRTILPILRIRIDVGSASEAANGSSIASAAEAEAARKASGSSSAFATMREIEKSTTTTTSIMTVTASTTVVNGPLALSSEMMAMAEEGERATERHAMRSATASCCPPSRAVKKGMTDGPKVRTDSSVPQ